MASQGYHLDEQTFTPHVPNEALYMDWETAMHRVKALFGAIRLIGSAGSGKQDLDHMIDLASLGESIVEDQLCSERTTKEGPATSEEF